MKPHACGCLRVNVYRLLVDGLESPLHAGLRHALKHLDSGLSDDVINRIVEQQENELLSWFCDHFHLEDE